MALWNASRCFGYRTHSVLSGASYISTPSSTLRTHWKILILQNHYVTSIWDICVSAETQLRQSVLLTHIALVTFAGWKLCKLDYFKILFPYISLNPLHICKYVQTVPSTLKHKIFTTVMKERFKVA